MITHSANETGQQKEQLGWRSEITGKWGERGTRGWTKFETERGGKQYMGVFVKKGG